MPNEEMIKDVIKHIELNNRWNQTTWGGLNDDQFTDDGEVRPEAWEMVPAYAIDEENNSVIVDAGLLKENACSTSFCFAGHTVLLAGDKILIDRDSGDAFKCVDKDGEVHNIEVRARNLLGLDRQQSDTLFSGEAGDKDLEKYKRLITRVTGVTFDEEQANA